VGEKEEKGGVHDRKRGKSAQVQVKEGTHCLGGLRNTGLRATGHKTVATWKGVILDGKEPAGEGKYSGSGKEERS